MKCIAWEHAASPNNWSHQPDRYKLRVLVKILPIIKQQGCQHSHMYQVSSPNHTQHKYTHIKPPRTPCTCIDKSVGRIAQGTTRLNASLTRVDTCTARLAPLGINPGPCKIHEQFINNLENIEKIMCMHWMCK